MTHYPEYKQTEFAWIGEIPSHWSLNRINSLFFRRKEKNINIISDNILSVLKDRGVIRYEDKGNIGNKVSERIDNYQLVHPGDLVINNMNVTIGSVGRSDQFGALSGIYIVLAPKRADVSMEYYHYLFKIRPFQKSLIQISTGLMKIREALNFIQFKALKLPTPPLAEQTQIANFLDHKTAQIDELIRAKERKIELLGEYRASLINQAVTKGLDPNVEMKSSGVEWIDELPSAWGVRKIKYIVSGLVGGIWGSEPQENVNDTCCIRVADFNYRKLSISTSNLTIRNILPNERSRRILKTNDLLLEKSGGGEKTPVGRTVMFNNGILGKSVTSNFISKFSVKYGLCDPKFLLYCLDSMYQLQLTRKHIKQSTGIQNLDIDSYFQEEIPFPSLVEQAQIAKFLDHKTKQIDELRSNEEGTIKLLKEYRQSLISEAVTGKIDVRGEV